MNSVGSRLKAARIARGLTQQQLANGVASKGFISLVERDRLNPSLPKLRLLADRLGQPLSHFVHEAAPQDPGYLLKTAELAIKANEPKRALTVIREAPSPCLAAKPRADPYPFGGLAFFLLGPRRRAL